jgi:D-threonate/D-erythronate kinase
MIADDLTGACDAGVQFAQQGFPTFVWLDRSREAHEGSGMLILSTDSRGDVPERAADKVRSACSELIGCGREIVFKKIDSTLRGNITAELEAAMSACGNTAAFLCPAFPAAGRTVTNGWLQLGPCRTPVHIPTLLREQGLRAEVRVWDATTQEELAAIVASARARNPKPLLAGSAGLAIEAARALAVHYGKVPVMPVPLPPRTGPVLCFAGSMSAVTASQVEHLRRRSAGFGLSEAVDALAAGRHAIVPVHWKPGELEPLIERLTHVPVRGMVFTGGDTARFLCRLLGAYGIGLRQEILPGIPCGTLAGGPFSGLPVATKAGGFGGPDALTIIAERL